MTTRRELLKLCGMAPLASQLAAGGGSYVRAQTNRGPWAVGNTLVERQVAFDSRSGLSTVGWLHKVTGTDFAKHGAAARQAGDEFSFQAGTDSFTGKSGFELDGAEVLALDGGKALELRLKHAKAGLAVNVFYAVYDEHPVIRKWIAIRNDGAQPVVLKRLCFESVSAGAGVPAELQLFAGYGTVPREIFFTGRVSDTALVSRNSRTGEGLVVLNEAPGYLKRTEMGGWGWNDHIQAMYDTDLFPFERTLEPGETFQSARSSVEFFVDGKGFADSRWVVPTYASRVLMRRGRSFQPRWLYNTWEPFERNIDEATSADLIRVAGRMGMDIFTIDDGWQAEYGDNRENRENFPGGLAKIGALLKEQKMSLGLWVPLAAISTGAPDYKQHPEWLCRDRAGHPKFTGTMAGQQAVMCLGSAYREAAARRLIDLIEKYHPGYLKVDLTTVFNAYGEEPGCNAPGHFHKSWAESLERIYEGLQYVGERLYREHPEVLVDYTFELWGEKHLIDHALLGVADMDWLSNITDHQPDDAGPRQARTLLYHRALAIPAETMLLGNLHAATPPIEERFGVAAGSGPLLVGDLRKLTPEQQDWYASRVRWFKKLRSQASLNDSFFPLGEWAQPGVKSWDGFARLSREGDGIVVIFRNDSGATSVVLRLPAPPDAVYEARSVMKGHALGTVTASVLAAGWTAPLDTEARTDVIELRRR
ncbi:MAG: alpha-galactosidase [Bryobacteraceae bacterium]